VRCQNKDAGEALAAGRDDPTTLLSDCRILHKDDLQVVKGLSAPKVPDCFQKTPKKVMIPENGQILTTAVDTQG
jgi:E3 ubiquitin-protein ligase EDD1